MVRLTEGLATKHELRAIAEGWRRWATHPDGWYAVLHGEIVCRAWRVHLLPKLVVEAVAAEHVPETFEWRHQDRRFNQRAMRRVD